MIKVPKKLIEVALPLDDINAAAAREKSIRHGHPSTLHLWWARRPLAAARAVIFAQMVNDPGYQQGGGFKYGVNKKDAAIEREKLFDIIRDLVKWENTNNEEVLNRARKEIKKSWRETCELNKNHPQAADVFDPSKLPAFHDPFAGGGAIPLEAQRLGMESYASDLNPVAVMINKAMLEIPVKFAGCSPVGPVSPDRKQQQLSEDWSGTQGLAEDVRRYGQWMRNEALNRIGYLYPKILITPEIVSDRPDLKISEADELLVVAWLWARTVTSPNPAFAHVATPLCSTFVLTSAKGKEAWVEPIVDGDTYRFEVRLGMPPAEAKHGTKAGGRGANFKCLVSGSPIDGKYIKAEGQAGRLGQRLMAVVAAGKKRRVFLSPSDDIERTAKSAQPTWRPAGTIPARLTGGTCVPYGLKEWADIFTARQLVTLNTLSQLVQESRAKVIKDAKVAGMPDDGASLDSGGTGATAYGDALSLYLAFALDKVVDRGSTLTRWDPTPTQSGIINTFSRQALPMTWDFAESNPLGNASGNFVSSTVLVAKVIEKLPINLLGFARQDDAASQCLSDQKVVSTDPPYYDNIGYADLSDFFYVWMRRSLRKTFPSLFATMAVPKTEELVAAVYRHGDKDKAESFFMEGMFRVIQNLATLAHPAFPITIYYAFKQSETKAGSTISAGWATFLQAVIRAGFSIDGTWPMRTELANRMIGSGTNALASSIVLVCWKRLESTGACSRRDFQRQLREEMPDALETMIGGATGQTPIAPVDLAQAAIGPGMGIFSQYEAVLNQDGTMMSVHDALVLINRAITEYLNPESGNFDSDTLFCDSWFAEYGWSTGQFGQANVLAQAKGTTVDDVRVAGVIESGGNKVRLLRWREYPIGWDPKQDNHTPVWEALHHVIRALNQEGESGAGELLAGMPQRGESIRQLAYHLYTLCERNKWAEDARAYNELIASWHAIVAASNDIGPHGTQVQMDLDS